MKSILCIYTRFQDVDCMLKLQAKVIPVGVTTLHVCMHSFLSMAYLRISQNYFNFKVHLPVDTFAFCFPQFFLDSSSFLRNLSISARLRSIPLQLCLFNLDHKGDIHFMYRDLPATTPRKNRPTPVPVSVGCGRSRRGDI
jgi:hypothetical protein